jgi:hypothetical protein
MNAVLHPRMDGRIVGIGFDLSALKTARRLSDTSSIRFFRLAATASVTQKAQGVTQTAHRQKTQR